MITISDAFEEYIGGLGKEELEELLNNFLPLYIKDDILKEAIL